MTRNGALAGAALVLGFGAVLAGSPFRADRLPFSPDEMTAAIAAENDRLDPIALARWIRDRRSDLRVIDLRDRQAFDAYSIPTAEWIPLDRVARAGFRPDETIVLYADGGAVAAQAWVVLRALGRERLLYLEDGLAGWLDRVINASLPADASAEARAAFRDVAELSRYFGGTPRIGAPTDEGEQALPRVDVEVGEMRRRGCAL